MLFFAFIYYYTFNYNYYYYYTFKKSLSSSLSRRAFNKFMHGGRLTDESRYHQSIDLIWCNHPPLSRSHFRPHSLTEFKQITVFKPTSSCSHKPAALHQKCYKPLLPIHRSALHHKQGILTNLQDTYKDAISQFHNFISTVIQCRIDLTEIEMVQE